MKIISLRVGYFLANRQIRRSSYWITALIIFIMMVTFLNLVVVSGILVGLISASSNDFRKQYSGDVFIEPQAEYRFVDNSRYIYEVASNLPGVAAVSVRYLEPVQLESDYKRLLTGNKAKNIAATVLTGIDPESENNVTGLSNSVIEGSYLVDKDSNQVLIGSSLLKQYSDAFGTNTLDDVYVGTKIKLTIGDISQEVTIKGIVKTKTNEISGRVFMDQKQMRRLIDRNPDQSNEMAILLRSANFLADADNVKNDLINSKIDKSAMVQNWEEAQGSFFKDLSSTFAILGNVIGATGLGVASITIFIVIYINAVSRRKFIGILKGVGISGSAIRFSYLFQSLFYAFMGTALGLLVLYGLLVPYFEQNPIDFPFSDGILAVSTIGTAWRVGLLFLTTLVAGFIPAQIIIRKNTLDSILGR